MYQTKIALRSLFYRKTQYISLFLVCMFGVAISLSAIAVSTGMIRSMNQKAKIYYGGDFAMMCATDDGLAIFDYEDSLELIKSTLPEDAVVTPRMDLLANDAAFYFEGVQALQRTIKGINFKNEKDLISSFYFVEGDFDIPENSNGLLISLPIAKMLNVHAGDEITFQIKTYNNFLNTVPVVVKGIFQDSSVFGTYTSYMDFNFLKKAYDRPENFANRICVNFPNRKIKQSQLHEFYDSLKDKLNMYDWVDDKDVYIDARPDTTERKPQ